LAQFPRGKVKELVFDHRNHTGSDKQARLSLLHAWPNGNVGYSLGQTYSFN